MESFRRSVRIKLMAMVLVPLLLGVPLLMGLVWTWGNQAYDRMLRAKASADLVSAHESFERAKQDVGQNLQAIAESSRLAELLRENPSSGAISRVLEGIAAADGFDFLHYLDPQGRGVAPPTPASRAVWPAVAAALAGAPHTTVDVFSPTELAGLAPTLQDRARQALLTEAAAVPARRVEEQRGLLIHAAAPVPGSDGAPIGVLEAGVLLNNNLKLIDGINAILYGDGGLPLGGRGTTTLFLGDARIATDVRLFEGHPALGTRASAAVRLQVLEAGEVLLDIAPVVDETYASAYEPIVDGRGARVGMLSVGFQEAPFRRAKWTAFGTLCAVFLGLSGLGAALSLRWAGGVFRPIEQIHGVIQRIEAGEATARVGAVAGDDEVGRLATGFDHLLDTLAGQREELQRWADELDAKVMKRTTELAQAYQVLSQARQKLLVSEKLAAIGELTAGVAHEINNPVAVIQGNLDVLQEALGPAAEPVREEIRLIHQQANRIHQIVARLLQFSRPGEFAGYVEAVDVNGMLQDCLVLTRHNLERHGIAVNLSLAAVDAVDGNRGELQQVFINLLINAVQAMPDGGTLTLSSVDQPLADGAQGVLVKVADTGHGIAAADMDRIFDPFFTTKKGSGTGLGLSISYAIVQRYGGEIAVRSSIGGGAEFSVHLRSKPSFDAGPEAPGFQARWASSAPTDG
jgi:two-component system NtrC family sensor kinase